MSDYFVAGPADVQVIFEKVQKYMPDLWRSQQVFYNLYSRKDSYFFIFEGRTGAFWFTEVIPGWKANVHTVLWDIKGQRAFARAGEILGDWMQLFRLQRLATCVPAHHSRQVTRLKRLGFVEEGILHKEALYGGKPTDMHLLVMMRSNNG